MRVNVGLVDVADHIRAFVSLGDRADAETKRKAIESAYQSLTPEPLPNWTADQDLLD